jgi:hypothetical protein
MPSCYSLVGHRKGFKRYSSEELQGLVADKTAAEEERERVEAGVLKVSRLISECLGWKRGARVLKDGSQGAFCMQAWWMHYSMHARR